MKKYIRKSTIATILWSALFYSLLCPDIFASELSPLSLRLNNNDVHVTTVFTPSQKFMEELNQGISKEVIFFIDLFRVWKLLPDEFVKGRKIIRTMRINNIKREYIGTSQEGNVITEKRFKDIASLSQWALQIDDISLSGLKRDDPASYYVKVTVESREKKVAPLIGYFLFFIPDKEFSVSRDSEVFPFGAK